MNYKQLFGNRERPVEVCVIGISGFNHSLFVYGSRSENFSIRVVCGRNIAKCIDGYKSVGVPAEKIVHCTTLEQGIDAFNAGKYLIFDDVSLAMKIPFDVAIEGTGHPEASAFHALAAIENGRHIVMVTKESDSVVGPILARKARQKGLIYSLAEGDQPSLLVGLVTWAQSVGLKILAAGKSSEYDFVFDEEAGTVQVLDKTIAVPEIRSLWHLSDDISATLERRAELLSVFQQRNIPDLAEMGIVCNHLPEFHPDIAPLHTPIARTLEIPDVMCPTEYGGIFDGEPRIDVVNCFRRVDEQSLEGGEWIVVACDDDETWEVLKEKGVPTSRNGKTAMLYYPAHYLGLEALFSVLSVGVLGMPTGSAEPRPRYDLVARAERSIPAGTKFQAKGHHHVIDGLEGLLLPAEPLTKGNHLPYFLVDGTTLKKEVQPGTMITEEMLEIDGSAILWKLRREQDREFFSVS